MKMKIRVAVRIIRTTLLILLAAVMGWSIFSFNAERLAGNAIPMPFGYGISVVISGSMSPVIEIGDLVIIKETDEVTVGDVVVYQSGRNAVLHRLTEIQEEDGRECYITRGDANNADDTPIEKEQIKGICVRVIPKIGVVVSFFKTPTGILTELVTIILFIYLTGVSEKREREQELSVVRDEIIRLQRELLEKESQKTNE